MVVHCFTPLLSSSSAARRSVAAVTDGLYDVIESIKVLNAVSTPSSMP